MGLSRGKLSDDADRCCLCMRQAITSAAEEEIKLASEAWCAGPWHFQRIQCKWSTGAAMSLGECVLLCDRAEANRGDFARLMCVNDQGSGSDGQGWRNNLLPIDDEWNWPCEHLQAMVVVCGSYTKGLRASTSTRVRTQRADCEETGITDNKAQLTTAPHPTWRKRSFVCCPRCNFRMIRTGLE